MNAPLIHITATLTKLQAANISTRFHCASHALCIQRTRIAEVCKSHGIQPVFRVSA